MVSYLKGVSEGTCLLGVANCASILEALLYRLIPRPGRGVFTLTASGSRFFARPPPGSLERRSWAPGPMLGKILQYLNQIFLYLIIKLLRKLERKRNLFVYLNNTHIFSIIRSLLLYLSMIASVAGEDTCLLRRF